MPVASAERTRVVDHKYYNGYPLMHGPVADVQAGAALIGGKAKNEIVVTNLNNSGAGSLRQACADAITATGGWITFAQDLDGDLTLSSPIVLNNADQITIDFRGNDITLVGYGIHFTDSGNPTRLGNYLLLNGRQSTSSGGVDSMSFQRDTTDMSPGLVAFWEWEEFNSTDGDEALDWYLSVPDDGGVDFALMWSHFDGTHSEPAGVKRQGWLINGNANSLNVDKFSAFGYRNHIEGINFRAPLFGGNGVVTADAFLGSLGNYIKWREDGIVPRQQVQTHSLADTFDATFTGSSANAGDGAFVETGAKLRVDGPREIRNPSFPSVQAYNAASPGSVTTMQTRWPSVVTHTASADEDTITKNRATACLGIRHSGTIDGLTGDAIVGETFIVPLPATRTWEATLDAAAQRASILVLDENFEIHPTIVGTDIFTDDGDVVRTSSRIATFTASATIASAERIYLVWAGTQDIVAASGKTSYLEGWNAIAIEPFVPNPPHALAGAITSASALAGSLTVISGTPGTASVAVSGSLRTASELDIRRGGAFALVDVLGGRNLQTTLTSAMKQAIVDGLSAATSPRFGWNNVVRDALDADTYVTRVSDTQVRIGPLPAFPAYDVHVSEQINITFPESALA